MKEHWENVYGTKSLDQVSWFQPHAERSLSLVRDNGAAPGAAIIDVGGGASVFADDLLDAGYTNVTVLDLSATALAKAQARLGDRAKRVTWIAADVLAAGLPEAAYDVWHDRAVLHFMTGEEERAAYRGVLERALKPGGLLITATFAEDGPERCSGLPVRRYAPADQDAFFAGAFDVLGHEKQIHRTPGGGEQRFTWGWYRRR